ncbi:hypothetical protein HYU92_00210 [Candidatus Curtissbacteria bacterium]|nr:hypothetical protein [Candidatus Curtissbacteria bacterium]
MIRTQIYIPETLHERAKSVARSKKQSLANLYRGFISDGLHVAEKKRRGNSLDSLIKLNLKGGPKNLSANIDHYLYGAPKKR